MATVNAQEHRTPLLAQQPTQAYLHWLDDWLASRPRVSLVAAESVLVVVDMLDGFCRQGPLASPRIAAIVDGLTALVATFQEAGGHHVLLPQDAHRPDDAEFAWYPPHCLAGTDQARTVAPLAALAGPGWQVVPKHTISALAEQEFRTALGQLVDPDHRPTFVVIGNCTDLCIYQAAMGIMLNTPGAQVVLPHRAVATYDLPVEAPGGPHPGDLLHAVFLAHMASNGVQVVEDIRWQMAGTEDAAPAPRTA
jgi:nicotinamidase-related amidase